MQLSWQEMVAYLNACTNVYIHYVDFGTYYAIEAANGPFVVKCSIQKSETTDCTDFETNWKSKCNKPYNLAVDIDGAQIVNPKFAGSGRGYQSLNFELHLGKRDEFYCKNYKLEDVPFFSVLNYKSETELLQPEDDESLIVKTEVILAPQFDYDIQGFCLYQNAQPTTDIKMWAVMVPFLPVEYGGPKEVISGLCLDDAPWGVGFMDYVGDSATTMKYQGPGSNEMMLIFRMPAGTQHKIMGELFWYV